MLDRTLTVRVTRITRQTPEILAFELAHPQGRALPAYSAGAHLDVHMPGGFMRQYSIARAPAAEPGAPYLIAVKREPASRGGSAAMHQRVREGDLLPVSLPRNTFPLRAEARRHLLLAGGIGMTPLLAMAQALARSGADFQLCCFARSHEQLAFAEALREPALAPHVRLHFDDPAALQKIDLGRLLAEPAAGTHLYVCGPAGFMQAVRAAAAQWPDEAVHTEYFAPPASSEAGEDSPFELVLARRGITVPVAAGQSAVGALHELGIDIPTSCEQGLCGTCVVDLLEGEAEHRDHCLSSTERRHRLALCCSRARSPRLVLDL
jgi:vanillate monooxygenase ferredoxin subunit